MGGRTVVQSWRSTAVGAEAAACCPCGSQARTAEGVALLARATGSLVHLQELTTPKGKAFASRPHFS